ncbi:uncharacterized protein LOC144624205 isoform X2 [Crassostrea virginica]
MCAKKKHADLLRGQMFVVETSEWRGFTVKINLSILTLWVIIDHWTKSFGFCMDFMVAQKDMIILERSCIKSMLIDGSHNQNTILFLLAHLS